MTVLEVTSFRVVVGVLALGPSNETVTSSEGNGKVRSLLHDALEAVEDVRVEGTLHGVLLEGRNRVLDDAPLGWAAHVTPPTHLLIDCVFVNAAEGEC